MSGRGRITTDPVAATAGGRLVAPSAERNRQPIIDALGPLLAGASGTVLEIGSGTGQHVAALAAAFPGLDWQPSERVDACLESIRAWAATSGLANLRPPIRLDAAKPWPDLGQLDRAHPSSGASTPPRSLAAVLAINVIHIAPWEVAEGIVRDAGRALAPGGALIFYGPFKEGGRHTGGGNEQFDAMLRAEDPGWGVRDLDDLSALAASTDLGPPQVTPMPANNRLVSYRSLGG